MENLLPVTTSAAKSQPVHIISVTDSSRPTAIATLIARSISNVQHVELQVVGASGIHRAVRAIALARQTLEGAGMDIACTPTFTDAARTAVCFLIKPCHKP